MAAAEYGRKYPPDKEEQKYSDILSDALAHRNRGVANMLGLLNPLTACGYMGGAGLLSKVLEDSAQRQLAMNHSALMTTLVQDTFHMKAVVTAFKAEMKVPTLTPDKPISDPELCFEWAHEKHRNGVVTLLSPPHSPIQTLLARMFLTSTPEEIPTYYLIELHYRTSDLTFTFKLFPKVKVDGEDRSIVWRFQALVPTAPECDNIELSKAPDDVQVYRMN